MKPEQLAALTDEERVWVNAAIPTRPSLWWKRMVTFATRLADARIELAAAREKIALLEAQVAALTPPAAPGRTDTQRLEFVLRELCVAAAHNLRHTWAPKDRAEVDAAMDADASEVTP